jgi:flagellar protein FlaG
MPTGQQTKITIKQSATYREAYANSVQVQVSMWDFFLAFGTMHQDTPEAATITNEQGIYLSPQQAKALWNVLGQNLSQYEQAFGPLSLEAKAQAAQAVQ